uniref:BACON domain-containing protein n=1 Tax=Candidatus Cryptobacteroides bacterium TaxID=3085639 RepID=UPI0040264F3A
MRIRTLISGSLALAAMLFAQSCGDKNEPEGLPEINLSKNVIEFQQEASSETIKVASTRQWFLSNCPEWIAVDPESGKDPNGMDVTISVLGNTGLDREAALKFSIGYDTKTLTVKQKGTGSAADAIVYANDFDKTEATKTFGTGTSWPYLDQFDGWKNASGTGIGAETYSFSGMSARANSTSNSNYSDYKGSGSNNLFFGSSAYFSIQGIKLPSDANYSLTFGAEKYNQDNGSLFKHDEFHVYVSNDAKKWVEIEYTFPDGDKEGRWDLATSNFTVPEGTSSLSIYVKTDVASSYRLDDLKLSVAAEAGTVIDFSKGVDLGTGGGETPEPTPGAGTIAEIAAGAENAAIDLKDVLVTGVTLKSYVITDATGSILVFANADPKVKVGDKINVTGTTGKHNGLMQITTPTATVVSSGNTVTYPAPLELTEAKMKEDAPTVVTYVSFTGTVKKKGTYYNIFVGNYEGKDLSCSYYTGNMEEFVDCDIKVEGWYVGGNPHYQVVATKVEEVVSDTPKFSVSTETLTAKAADKSVSFDVKGNVKWTVASDNAAYKVSPESGDGNGTVTVSFAENTTDKDVTVKLTVSTTAEVATKSYTVTLTHKGVSAAGTEDFSSSVEWTLGTNAFSEKATVNGVADVPVLKIGSSKKAGTATLKIPAGTTKVSFYGVAWKGKTATIKASVGETQVATQALAANEGAANTAPYKLTVEDTDKYTITLPAKLEADTDVTVTTTTNARAILFAIRAE